MREKHTCRVYDAAPHGVSPVPQILLPVRRLWGEVFSRGMFFGVNENMPNIGRTPATYLVLQWFTPLTPKS